MAISRRRIYLCTCVVVLSPQFRGRGCHLSVPQFTSV